MSRAPTPLTPRRFGRAAGRRPYDGPLLLGRFVALVVIAVFLLGSSALAFAAAFGRITQTVEHYTDIRIPKIPVGPQTTFVYDDAGHLATTLHAEVNRTILPMAKISPHLRDAVIAIEDRSFYHHGALDPTAIVRAAYENAINGRIEQGGSTITQQLVKNLFTGDERTFSRKIHEAVLAVKLEHVYSKNEILEKYLNTVYFGHGAYGAEAAAETYFGVPASRLGTLRAATLAGLIAAPGTFDPAEHRGLARARRNVVLDKMAEQSYISASRAAHLKAQPLRVPGLARPDQPPYPYFMQYATQQLLRITDYDRTFEGGLRVQTTLDVADQQAAEKAVTTHLPSPHDPSAALVAIDPATGAIRALVGGRDFSKGKFNLATQAHRQTGSAAKTFTLATAMEQHISLNSIWSGPPQLTIQDPRCLDPETGKEWDVSNFADESAGTMTLKDAIANSVNTIFAQLVLDVGPDSVADMAHRLGIRSHLEDVCSITLGSQAVTPLEMTAAYATLAARGIHHNPTVISSVRDASGHVLFKAKTKGNRALDQNDADLVSYALRGVVEHGTGTAAAIGRPVAGKTGTGQNFQDAWFCGYTPQLATCVWVGYKAGEIPMHDVEGFPDVFGGSIPALIWHDFMSSALAGRPVLDFPTPDFSQNTVNPEHSVTLPPPSPKASPSPSPKPTKCPFPNPKRCHHHGPNPSPTEAAWTQTSSGSDAGRAPASIAAMLLAPLLVVLAATLRRRPYRGRHRTG